MVGNDDDDDDGPAAINGRNGDAAEAFTMGTADTYAISMDE
jgi:hypothetical protein